MSAASISPLLTTIDPDNTHFGDLITFNDFTLQPSSGFDTHSHREIEIISYCVNGELVHEDNLGNNEIINRGEMQYTCAGSGITHSERNELTGYALSDSYRSGYVRNARVVSPITAPTISNRQTISTGSCRSYRDDRWSM